MNDYRIETRNRPGEPWELWANRRGSRPQAEASARSLLRELQANNPKARVRMAGHLIRKEA